jgi:hypothetical protein
MAINFEIKVSKKTNEATIAQTAWVHFVTRERLIALVKDANGKIVEGKNNYIKATVNSEKTAKAIIRTVERECAKARKNKPTAEKEAKNDKATSRVTKSVPATAKGKAPKTVVIDGVKYVRADEEKSVPTASANAKKGAHKGAKSGKNSAPTKAKWQTELDKIAHEGKGANSKATKILQKHGFKGSHGTPEWDYWMGVRA